MSLVPMVQSYVWHKDKCFLVSTVEMKYEFSPIAGLPYSETMVWEWDSIRQARKTGDILHKVHGDADSLKEHVTAVHNFYKYGRASPNPED